MRRPCCAGPGTDDLDAAARLGADVPFCLVGGRALVSGIGEVVEPLPVEPLTVTLVVPPLHVSTPAVYRAWDALGGPTAPTASTTSSRRRSPSSRSWRRGATASRPSPARSPTLAGSGATWFLVGERDDALAALRSEGVAVVVAHAAGAG